MNKTELIVSQDHYFNNMKTLVANGYKVKAFEGRNVRLRLTKTHNQK